MHTINKYEEENQEKVYITARTFFVEINNNHVVCFITYYISTK